MINKLRIKFICYMMTIIFGVFFVICLTIIVALHLTISENAIKSLSRVKVEVTAPTSESNGLPVITLEGIFDGEQPSPNDELESFRSFVILIGEDGGIVIATFDESVFTFDEIKKVGKTALLFSRKSGREGSVFYEKRSCDYGTIVLATDKTIELNMLGKTSATIVTIAICSLLFLFLIIFFMSKFVIQPAKDAFKKQKQFISDASHELKTPLSIISANCQILDAEQSDNKWIKSISEQTKRISDMISELLELTRLDELEDKPIKEEFDLSRAILNSVLAFESVAYEANKKFIINIPKGIEYVGNEADLKKCISILTDNAIKHSTGEGIVEIDLSIVKQQKPVIIITNSGCSLTDKDVGRIFERFYRGDASRDRKTGGYGLGLAIVKQIVEKNKWNISVEIKKDVWTRFVIEL